MKAIDAAEERFKAAARAADETLSEEHSDLGEQGFSGLAADLDVVEQLLGQARTEMDAAGDGFEQAVEADAQEVERELADTEAKVDAAAAETRREQEEAETQAREDASSFETMGGVFVSSCETLFGEMSAAYDEFDDDVEDAASSLDESVRKSVQAEADEIEAEIGTSLQQPTEAVLDPDAPNYLKQVGAAEEAVRGVIETGQEMEKTVDNLLVCKDVCDLIKETLAQLD
jgi:hypothetical protein